MKNMNTKIYIIGLGYGGPLAVAFAEKFQVIRFDKSLLNQALKTIIDLAKAYP